MPHRLLFILLTLYFAQGLPSGFITQALPAILREYGVSLEMIGLSGILLAPWALKFLWAPLVDRYHSPKWGRARSWILPLQLLSALIVFAVGFVDPTTLSDSQTLWAFYAMLFCLSLVGATHDVATDALATRSLAHPTPNLSKQPVLTETLTTAELTDVLQTTPAQRVIQNTDKDTNPATFSELPEKHSGPSTYRGAGNAVQVIGYRMGLILGGGVFLLVLDILSWQTAFWAMAGLILLNTVPIAVFRETPTQTSNKSADLKANAIRSLANKSPFDWQRLTSYLKVQYGYFWHNLEMRAWLLVLLTFKIVDGVSSGMVKPMMVDMGIPTASIGLWVSVLGSGASLIGAGVAAVLLKYIAHDKALLWFNGLQVATTGLYLLVAVGFEHRHLLGLNSIPPFWWAYGANAVEHFAASLALVAMLSMVMHYARPDKAGSDFTTQVCLLTVFSGSAHLFSGFMASAVGYTGHFAISVALGVLCLLPIVLWRRVYTSS